MVTLQEDAAKATVMALRRRENDLENRCDELFHALACALAVHVDPDTGNATHATEQHLLDWARSFMGSKQAIEIAKVASYKYAQREDPPCRHDWAYDHSRGGMLCDACGEFLSDQL